MYISLNLLFLLRSVRKFMYIPRALRGPGGMPVGTNGKAMLLLSGGIDSPVAGYMIAKRGVKIEAVYFHAPPYHQRACKTEGCGPGEAGGKIQWTDQASCSKFHRHSAVHLRSVST